LTRPVLAEVLEGVPEEMVMTAMMNLVRRGIRDGSCVMMDRGHGTIRNSNIEPQ